MMTTFLSMIIGVLLIINTNGYTLGAGRGPTKVKFNSWNMPKDIYGVRNPYSKDSSQASSRFFGKPTLTNAEELIENAKKLTVSGKGLLACDESTGTIGTRLEGIGLENTEENRMIWRNLLFTSPSISDYISGAILYEETLFQKDPSGKPFVDVLREKNIIPGIKVDTGLKPLVGSAPGEKWCTGLDDLRERAEKFYVQGARFAKWRTALEINCDAGMPSVLAVKTASDGLAQYARICQEEGLVPIVEPEILLNGDHTIETTAMIQEMVLSTVYQSCRESGVLLEGSLLKPSITLPGVECKDKSNPKTIASTTVRTLMRGVPAAVQGIVFLSGGISEEDSSIYLSEINKIKGNAPWVLTFSFSRALQTSCQKIWAGKPDTYDAAQKQLIARCIANSEAARGQYKPGSQPSSEESLFIKDYIY